MVNPQQESIRISDTPLAAFIVTLGFAVDHIDTNGNRAYFVFLPTDTAGIKDAIRLWDSGKAECNVTVFHDNYKKLARRAREGY